MNSDQVPYLDIYFMQIAEVHVVNVIFLSESLLALELSAVSPCLSTLKFTLSLVVRFPVTLN